jgi:hypothetical protein
VFNNKKESPIITEQIENKKTKQKKNKSNRKRMLFDLFNLIISKSHRNSTTHKTCPPYCYLPNKNSG